MQLISLSIQRFRNISQAEIHPGPAATVLVGENGQGKTNTLEAIHLLGTLKSLRTRKLSEVLPLAGSPAALFEPAKPTRIEGRFLLAGGKRSLSLTLARGERLLEVDGKRAHAVEDFLGQMAVVAFTPDDLSLIKGGPDERRRFMDRAIFGRVPAFLSEARDYQRALKSRNQLLRERAPSSLREAFDIQLVRLGARVLRRRLELVSELETFARDAFAVVGRLEAPLRLSYRAAGLKIDSHEEQRLAQQLLDALEERLPLDNERLYTTVGPHADDLRIHLGTQNTRSYASQGQQRATVLALKIAEIESLKERLGRYPLLLLDDVSSELDPERNQHLMAYLRQLPAQVLMSTTDQSLISGASTGPVLYRVQGGRLSRESEES